MDVFSVAMSLGFAVQAVKLYPKRGFDWLILANILFAMLFALASFIYFLRVPLGILTALAFVRPTLMKRDLRFRLSHLAVLVVALIYTWWWL